MPIPAETRAMLIPMFMQRGIDIAEADKAWDRCLEIWPDAKPSYQTTMMYPMVIGNTVYQAQTACALWELLLARPASNREAKRGKVRQAQHHGKPPPRIQLFKLGNRSMLRK